MFLGSLSSVAVAAPATTFEIEEATVADMQAAMKSGELSSLELVSMYLERIAAYDKEGPKLNSVLEINPDALAIAEALDVERKLKGPRGPLHGIPVLLKDNIDTGDKLHTSAGSLSLADSYALDDSFVAKKLREAGAIILGKANMTEFANYKTRGMPGGYSSRGGQVLNPYKPGVFGTGGSSSGSGVSVSSNLTALAIGTETSGSILSPAYNNSVVGIKPTVGLISRDGIVPLAHSQDTAGPITRTVADAAVLLGALTGVDDKDPITGTSVKKSYTDYTPFLKVDGLKGARIGIPRDFYYTSGITDEEKVIFDKVVEDLKAQGAIIVDNADIPSAVELSQFNSSVFKYEFKVDMNAYLSGLKADFPLKTLSDIIKFDNTDFGANLKYGNVLLTEADATSGTLTDAQYIRDRLKDLRLSRTEGIDFTMKFYKLDALLFPNTRNAGISAKAGYPSITVPAGYTKEGKPVAVTFGGMAYSEPTLIKVAYSFEQATHYRVPPVLK
ncbi:amidase family protein [Cohnella lupini]|nr:amidase family protein [Cohnella lupini]